MKLIIDNTHRPVIVPQAFDCFTGAPVDYPTGVRFVPHVPVPTPMFSGSEIVTAAIVGFGGGALFTAFTAFVWSWFL